MLPVYLVIMIWLVVISVVDIKSRRVPVWLLAAGGAAALPAIQWGSAGECLAVLKGVMPGLLLLAAAFFTGRAGYGDGVVLLVLGMVSKGRTLVLFGVSMLLIAVFAVALLVFRRADRNTRLPYLPFLAVSWLLVFVF
ncbi:MAG: prepilin peptidase [Acetatifactor muris]|nr:prepilin peptidase [Acetatifactor muris]